jgi:predicted transcriptional regulator
MGMAVATDKIKVTAYVEPDVKEQLDRLCKARNRSASNLIETLIREAAKAAEEAGEI